MTEDQRPPVIQGMVWVQRILTASLMLVIPSFFGNWLDNRMGTSPLWLVIGAVLGIIAGGWAFYKILGALSKE